MPQGKGDRMNTIPNPHEPTSMPTEFIEWMEECPVEHILNSDDGAAKVEYTFFDSDNIWEY